MTDQLVCWLEIVIAVMLAATPYLNHLSAFFRALARVLTSGRALQKAIQPAKRKSVGHGRKVVRVGKRSRLTRRVSDRPA